MEVLPLKTTSQEGTVVTISARSASDAHTQTRPSTEKIEMSFQESFFSGSFKQDSSSRDKNQTHHTFSLPQNRSLTKKTKSLYISEHELVGPTELVRMYDLSIQPGLEN